MASEYSVCLWTQPGWLYYVLGLHQRRWTSGGLPESCILPAPRYRLRTALPESAEAHQPAWGHALWKRGDLRDLLGRGAVLPQADLCPACSKTAPFPTSSPCPLSLPLPFKEIPSACTLGKGTLMSPRQSRTRSADFKMNATSSGKPWGFPGGTVVKESACPVQEKPWETVVGRAMPTPPPKMPTS